MNFSIISVKTRGKSDLKPNQQSSVSGNAHRHHLREVLSNGLLDYQLPRCGGQVPSVSVSTCKDVAAVSQPHSLTGMLCIQGQGQDAVPCGGS